MLAAALLVAVGVEVALVVLAVQHDQVQVDLLLAVPGHKGDIRRRIWFSVYLCIAPVLCLQLVGAVVLLLGVVHHHGGDGAALVLVRAHGVVRAVTELPVRGVPPREHRRRLPAALDLPERSAPGPHRLGARLALVDGGGN